LVTERRSGSGKSSLTDAAFGVAVSDLAVRTFATVAVKVVAVALFEVLDLAGRERFFVERDELVRLLSRGISKKRGCQTRFVP
jgi:predicted GTPase